MKAKELAAKLLVLPDSEVDILDNVSGLPFVLVDVKYYDENTTAILLDEPEE